MSDIRYLLDTNVLSSLIKEPAGRLTTRLARVGEDAICTSIVVACELRYGATKKGSPTLSRKIDQLLASIEVFPLDEGVDMQYAEIRTSLEKTGTPHRSKRLFNRRACVGA